MNEMELLRRHIEQIEADKTAIEAENTAIQAIRKELEEENVKLRQTLSERELELKLLVERFYGRKSERFLDNPDQLRLEFGDSDQVEDAIEGIKQAVAELQETTVEKHTRRPRKPRREKLPDHLVREIVIVELPDDEKKELECIGYDSTETLVYVPGTLRVIETRYSKYVNPSSAADGVKQAPRAPGLVEGNRYDTSVAAQIIASKYGYHLPIYRQQDIFATSGWTPSRSTLLNITTCVAILIRPLIEFFAQQVRGDNVVGTDDTGTILLLPKAIPEVDPLDPKSKRVHEVLSQAIRNRDPHVKGKMWAYRGIHVPLNIFDFTVSRHRDGPDLFFIENDYQGTVLGDCYGANTGITMRSSGTITFAACVAHARRKVRDARDNHPAHARMLLAMFRELYDIEDRGRNLDTVGRLDLRQREATAVWARIRDYIDTEMTNVFPKEAMGKAIGYLNNQWNGLTRYLSDGAIPIDNNETEQLMKQVALGRKNWMFVGSVAAGYRAADLMTLTSSAIRNNLCVWSYIKGVLDALLAGSLDYTALRPDAWAASHPEHIRQYRVDEKKSRAERTGTRRQERRDA